ncbi:MAG: sulfur carrier protein ThiS [Bacteroidales bacterium]|jgi:sulfur carrier protein
MEILINNQLYTMPAASSLDNVLNVLSIHEHSGIAMAVNEVVVPKSQWAQHVLTENDKVLIIRAAQGG